ncbi:peroxiredoxin-like family protein [Phenylobacterium sp.]|uniref:peroxiredoxin-like family protein n=1 Tax=Phenylobacterium sp. TaxID=1871053 RepID=UPI0025D5E4C9|nr:peroxiredoxin-like family protein [Phenylobacterium sp.]
MAVQDTLRSRLAALHEERKRTWEPAALQANIDQRRRLVEAADPGSWVRAGNVVAPFTLSEVDGQELTLDGLLVKGPLVLVFFRFAGCPACNIALPYYQERLAPGLAKLGATLVAVSPQVPEKLAEIKRRHDLTFLVASDRNELGRRFGILYEPDEASKAASRAKGSFIGDTTGLGTWELPQPAVVVIGQDRVVRFAEVSPDWLVRAEAETVLEALSVPAI